EVAGYLNFSAGASDRQFLANLNALYRALDSSESPQRCQRAKGRRGPGWPDEDRLLNEPAQSWCELAELLRRRLEELKGSVETFRDVSQALAVIDLAHNHV